MTSEEGIVHVGSGDFLRDQGVADPDEMRAQFRMQHQIVTIAAQRGLSADDLASLTGLPTDDAKKILGGGFSKLPVWPLMKAVAALGCNIQIYVGEPTESEGMIFTMWPCDEDRD